MDSCNCDWGCPCNFNARPTNGNCEGLLAAHIKRGQFRSLNLAGLNIAIVYVWPGPIHEGKGKASYYIDSSATDAQFEALSAIITGKAGGSPFETYASTLAEYHGPLTAKIEIEAKDYHSRARIASLARLILAPMRNPVTKKIFRAKIVTPQGFESKEAEVTSLRTLWVDDGYLKFKYEGTYGMFEKTTWRS